ncbi:DUF3043 domain-containing protein [Cellulomonas fimi]|uniref:DUF3043 domain-containing protein n=1 Tax=Cellulomonas fimi TaxID=1708 RepID=UPI002893476C|nr:DUF3043 domain-containing protein [Cellulomonas fimi]
MFSRSKPAATTPPEGSRTPTTDDAAVPGLIQPGAGKGRPTPKRKEAEAANKRPLVPTDRRAAAKSARAAARVQRDLEFRAMQTGDERHLPAKDRGPVRRYLRDHVDARWNLGEFFLPVALVFVVLTFALGRYPQLLALLTVVLYGIVLLTILDAYLMWRGLKKKLVAKFGGDARQRGLAMYAVMRAFQLRRARLPRVRTKQHGHYPD